MLDMTHDPGAVSAQTLLVRQLLCLGPDVIGRVHVHPGLRRLARGDDGFMSRVARTIADAPSGVEDDVRALGETGTVRVGGVPLTWRMDVTEPCYTRAARSPHDPRASRRVLSLFTDEDLEPWTDR